jgi:hypothetical protein
VQNVIFGFITFFLEIVFANKINERDVISAMSKSCGKTGEREAIRLFVRCKIIPGISEPDFIYKNEKIIPPAKA